MNNAIKQNVEKSAKLESENRRLKTALQEIATHDISEVEGHGRDWMRHGEPDLCENCKDMTDIAIKALDRGDL